MELELQDLEDGTEEDELLRDKEVSSQPGYDPATGSPTEIGSNWLSQEGIDPFELGQGGDAIAPTVGMEDREDNGQSGPTQENGGLGLGDEEGLGRTGLSEAGDISDQDRSVITGPEFQDEEVG